jgi:hypothetical protein
MAVVVVAVIVVIAVAIISPNRSINTLSLYTIYI